ncbi:MAG: GNAT family protein [archaeon]
MILKSKDFKLRPFGEKDFKDYIKGINDKLIGKNMAKLNYPATRKELVNNFKKLLESSKKKENVVFVILYDNKFAGIISLSNIILKLSAKIGYWVSSEYRGKGLGTKSIELITKFGFKKYKLRRIYANVRTHNKASVRVLEKCGFKLEGIQRKSTIKKGIYYDDFLYAKVK